MCLGILRHRDGSLSAHIKYKTFFPEAETLGEKKIHLLSKKQTNKTHLFLLIHLFLNLGLSLIFFPMLIGLATLC